MEAVAERGKGRGRVRMRGGGRVRGMGRAGRGVHGQRRQHLSNEIRATLVDHVINRGLTMREAGQRVQPNLSCFTVRLCHSDMETGVQVCNQRFFHTMYYTPCHSVSVG